MALQIPLHTTNTYTRPTAGEIRFNADTNQFESYNGSQWYVMGDGSSTAIQPWVKWWAWYPVRVHGHWVWGKTIYRKQPWLAHNNYPGYEYGTLFDVLRDA